MTSYLGQGLLRRGLAMWRGNAATSPGGVVFGAIRDLRREALRPMGGNVMVDTRRDAHTIEIKETRFMSAAKVNRRLNKHLISVGTVKTLKDRQFFEKRHQKRRRLKCQLQRNYQLRKVQDMADWADYLKAKGVPLPHRKPKHKWV